MEIDFLIICAALNETLHTSKSISTSNKVPAVRHLDSPLSHVRCMMGNLVLGEVLFLGLAFSEISVTVTLKQGVKFFLNIKTVALKVFVPPPHIKLLSSRFVLIILCISTLFVSEKCRLAPSHERHLILIFQIVVLIYFSSGIRNYFPSK